MLVVATEVPLSRPTIHAPGGEVPIIGAAAKQPQQPAIVIANDKGEPVIFPCVSAHILTDHCKQELVTLIAACVDAALDRRGLGKDPDAVPPALTA
jgi:hypothetical protein